MFFPVNNLKHKETKDHYVDINTANKVITCRKSADCIGIKEKDLWRQGHLAVQSSGRWVQGRWVSPLCPVTLHRKEDRRMTP